VTRFALRAPWYERERDGIGLRDPAALRPTLQMYDDTNFVRRIVADPRDSLAFGDGDRWTYPVPVTPSGTGRARLATWQLISTGLRKLYQPSHDRFYAVVVEVFCDQPGLPRAGSHGDIEVGFVMRRQLTSVAGARGPSRRVARALLTELAGRQELPLDESVTGLRDVRDLWWADQAWRRRFAEDNAEQLDQLDVHTDEQGWFVGTDGTADWRPVDDVDPELVEQTLPMWRLPARDEDCAAARTRSTWFGLVPTYSGEHATRDKTPRPKYDTQAIYQIRCFVRLKPPRGKEKCPPRIWWSEAASEPFRIADPMDPEGTSKRLTSITLPDLRRLAARAGRPMGPGGVAITTPPKSQLVFNPFNPTKGALGNGGSICTFALELFFLVAFFLFLMFLPVVVFLFQLWFLLALRFCIPPSLGLSITADFFAQGKLLADFDADVQVQADLSVRGLTPEQAIDQIFGTDSTAPGAEPGAWLDELLDAKDDGGNAIFADDADLMHAVVTGTDPDTAEVPAPPPLEPVPDDPLCR
jgi:hypothetical protein